MFHAIHFTSDNVLRHELDELVVEHLENFASEELQLRYLTWQVVVQRLRDCLSERLIVLELHVQQLAIFGNLTKEAALYRVTEHD